ncbi:MAG TPA: hypothetical protein VIE65_22975 [Methylobacter sp.]|jgi:hypothetical protein
MAKKLPDDLSASGLGDIDKVLNNQSVSDYSWLDVDVDEYRKFEALPKQNLDMIPELNRALAWDGVDERVPSLIPLRPHVVVNTNPLESPAVTVRSSRATVKERVASYIMAGLPSSTISHKLDSEFSPSQIRAEASEVRDILEERGLLGNVYINAAHFRRCAQEGAHRQFVAKHARRALYVLSKSECTNCTMNRGGICASFQKHIVDEVPYNQVNLAHYSIQLAAEKRLPPASGTVKERLRVAFRTSPITARGSAPQTVQYQRPVVTPTVTRDDLQAYMERQASKQAPEPADPNYLIAIAKLTRRNIGPDQLASSSDPEVRKAVASYGLVGHTYIDADALGGPVQTKDFLSSSPNKFSFIVLRDPSAYPTEEVVSLSKISTILPSIPKFTRDHFIAALENAFRENRITTAQLESAVQNVADGSDWARLTAQANLYAPPELEPTPEALGVSPAIAGTFYHGSSAPEIQKNMDPEEVRMSIASMMNTGLSGARLKESVLSRYSSSDLSQVPEIGAFLSPHDGVMGFHYLDPTAYTDYGKGCIRGSSSLRSSKAAFVLANSSCTGCTHQTAPSWCNRYARRLIRNIPDEVIASVEAARRLPVIQVSPVENPVDKYGLRSELHVNISGSKSHPVDISIPSGSLSD